jgi:L-ascorbate metabolism protein UlaG (beta-lactamase superfamily)
VLSRTNKNSNAISNLPYPELTEALSGIEVFTDQAAASDWKISSQLPGIFRLQHASFLLQTKKAKVLIDPHFVSGYSHELPTGSLMLPHNFTELNLTAVLITHSHSDHYDLPSLMMLPRDIFMIVPKVPKASILAPRFEEELRALGFQNVVEADWYSDPVKVEDIEIRAFPFYGEQPLRHEFPRHPLLRNWGNSYTFQTPDFSAWCLIDSGADASGSMVDVAEEVKKRIGPVEVVLSNLHEFFIGVGRSNPFYTTGGGEYWLSLTADQIGRFPELCKDMITLGPKGVAEVCAIVNAKTFLPYSHLWSAIGAVPFDEPQLLNKFLSEPMVINKSVDVKDWRIGDFWKP